MTTPDDIFLFNDRYSRLVTALADLQPCPFAGRITEDQIKCTLGEAGDIWPREIQAAVIIANLEDVSARFRVLASRLFYYLRYSFGA